MQSNQLLAIIIYDNDAIKNSDYYVIYLHSCSSFFHVSS